MTIQSDLISILNTDNVSIEESVLDEYSKDYSFVKPRRPNCVVFAENATQIQQVVKYANEQAIPVTPRSSAIGFFGAGIPGEGGIIVDCSGMNSILEIHDIVDPVRKAL